MQKLLFLIVIALWGCSTGNKVYLCNGPHSKAYHKTNHCQGLRECTTTIEATNIATAKAKHRRECGYCYPKVVVDEGVQ